MCKKVKIYLELTRYSRKSLDTSAIKYISAIFHTCGAFVCLKI